MRCDLCENIVQNKMFIKICCGIQRQYWGEEEEYGKVRTRKSRSCGSLVKNKAFLWGEALEIYFGLNFSSH